MGPVSAMGARDPKDHHDDGVWPRTASHELGEDRGCHA